MKNIERIIESQYPPRQTNVAWKDVNENTLKFYVDGEWRALKDEDFRQKQADWNQADNTKEDFIKNKPTIPDAQIQSDWNQEDTSKADYIKNKPSIPSDTLIVEGTFNNDGNDSFTTTYGPEDLSEAFMSGRRILLKGQYGDDPSVIAYATVISYLDFSLRAATVSSDGSLMLWDVIQTSES